jgi:hypothetical protein
VDLREVRRRFKPDVVWVQPLDAQESGAGREPGAERITVGETSRENVYRQDRAGAYHLSVLR